MTEPLVFLPGMMCDARLYMPQLIPLSSERAVTVAPITQGERVEEIASNILTQLPRRFALAGLSMGGIIAMEILRRVPDRITRLCLMDTNPLADPSAAAAAREPQIAGARAGRLAEVVQDWMRPEYLAPGPRRQMVLQRMYAMAADLGPEVFIRQSRALQRRADQQDTLRTCRVPTMILCGEHDTLTPVKRHRFMAELIPNAELLVLPDAGHLPTLETPTVTLDALRDWLNMLTVPG